MVREVPADEDRVMTETHSQSDEQPRTGLATENLRSYERLRRSVTDRKIAGVAGGLGRHLNIDPTILRVLFVVLVFFGGAGLLIYAAAWLLVPEEGTERSVVQTSPSTRNTLLIVVGVLAALLLIGDAWGGVGFPWPLALVALVVAVVLLNRDRGNTPLPPSGPPAGPQRPGSRPAETATPAGSTPTSQETTMAHTDQPTTLLGPTPPAPPVGPWSYPAAGPPGPPAPPAPDRGPKLFGPTVALLLVALGSLGLYDSVGGDVVDAAYPALALTVIGVMLVVGAFVGRAGGLIFLGVVAALVLGITASAQDNWSTDTRLFRTPATAADVRTSYDITAGQIRLDLTEVEDLESLDGRRIDLEAAAGEILVLVPEGIDVDVDASIRLGGEIEVDGIVENGNGVDLNRRIDGGDDVSQLYLELDLVVGRIEVRQEEAA